METSLVLTAVRQNGGAFAYAEPALRGDRGLALEAVQRSGLALQFASESLRNDKELVMQAVEHCGFALQFAPPVLREDLQVAMKAVSLSDSELALALEARGSPLRHADLPLRADRHVVLEAVKQDGSALFFADEALKEDRGLVQQAWSLADMDSMLWLEIWTPSSESSSRNSRPRLAMAPARSPQLRNKLRAKRRCTTTWSAAGLGLLCLTERETVTAVGCFGDSHTEGLYGAEWVSQLQRRLRRECVNFGRNAWTCASVERRVRQAPALEEAVLLAGTNDAMMELAARAGNEGMLSLYRTMNQLPAEYEPSRENFSKSFRSLLAAVRAPRVAVLSLPPLGEASEKSEAARLLEGYNEEIRRAVDDDTRERVTYVPFGEQLKGKSGEDFDASSSGFSQSIAQMFLHTALRRVPGIGPSFDTLGSFYGREVVHDKIHLTERSASLLVELLAEALAGAARRGGGGLIPDPAQMAGE
eukprot:g30626.t1